jgi:hypothetical protein
MSCGRSNSGRNKSKLTASKELANSAEEQANRPRRDIQVSRLRPRNWAVSIGCRWRGGTRPLGRSGPIWRQRFRKENRFRNLLRLVELNPLGDQHREFRAAEFTLDQVLQGRRGERRAAAMAREGLQRHGEASVPVPFEVEP